MKYQDSREQSAEYLRLALPLMTGQEAGLHPVSYALWYEYVSGRNGALRQAVDEMLKAGQVLTEEWTHELFHRHVAGLDESLASRVADGFQKIMGNMSRSASRAGVQAREFGDVLAQVSGKLETDHGRPDGSVEVLLNHTQIMRAAISGLEARLEESHREIEQLRQEVSKAREDALADALTGLANRKAFEMAMASALEAPDALKVGTCLLMADIDHFKRVNDTYGHLFGDKVLRAVAQILKNQVKGKDTAARYGGEEFIVLLPETELEGARRLAEQIRAGVEKCRITRGGKDEGSAHITISLGVTRHVPGEPVSQFISRADAALYEAKNTGRNRVSVAADRVSGRG